MKFCPICGRPLADSRVCSCQEPSTAPTEADIPTAAQAEIAEEAPQPPREDSAPESGEQPEAQSPEPPHEPKPDSRFFKALKNMPKAVRAYLKNSEKLIEIAVNKNDLTLPLLFIAVLCAANLILGACFFTRMTDTDYYSGLGVLAGAFGGIYFRLHFGYVLLGAVMLTAVESIVCIGLRFLTILIFAKKAPAEALTGAVAEFGFRCIPVTAFTLTAGLLGLVSAWFVVPVLGFAAAYLVTVFVNDSLRSAEGYGNRLARDLIIAACVMVGVAVVFRMLCLICEMNYSDNDAVSLNGLINGLHNLTNVIN